MARRSPPTLVDAVLQELARPWWLKAYIEAKGMRLTLLTLHVVEEFEEAQGCYGARWRAPLVDEMAQSQPSKEWGPYLDQRTKTLALPGYWPP